MTAARLAKYADTLLIWTRVSVTERPDIPSKTLLRKGFLRSFVRWLVIGVVLVWSLAALILLAARWIDPPSTAVHIQRRLQAWIHHLSLIHI